MRITKKIAEQLFMYGNITDQYRTFIAKYGDQAWSDFVSNLVRKEARRVLAKKVKK